MLNLQKLLKGALILAVVVNSSYVCGAETSVTQFVSRQFAVPDDNGATVTKLYRTVDGPSYAQTIVASIPEPNRSILQLALAYPDDGQHQYWWPKKGEGSYDGSTTDVLLNGQLVMKGESKARTFCCGLTLEVFYKYLQLHPELAARVPLDKHAEFKRLWFCRNINSPGPLDAMSAFQVGAQVADPEKALPGDFVQIWRNNKSGHSVLFVNWIRDLEGKRVGLQYWSTQPVTGGIGFNSELFGLAPKQVIESQISVARPLLIN